MPRKGLSWHAPTVTEIATTTQDDRISPAMPDATVPSLFNTAPSADHPESMDGASDYDWLNAFDALHRRADTRPLAKMLGCGPVPERQAHLLSRLLDPDDSIFEFRLVVKRVPKSVRRQKRIAEESEIYRRIRGAMEDPGAKLESVITSLREKPPKGRGLPVSRSKAMSIWSRYQKIEKALEAMGVGGLLYQSKDRA